MYYNICYKQLRDFELFILHVLLYVHLTKKNFRAMYCNYLWVILYTWVDCPHLCTKIYENYYNSHYNKYWFKYRDQSNDTKFSSLITIQLNTLTHTYIHKRGMLNIRNNKYYYLSFPNVYSTMNNVKSLTA